jgi:predicted GIY-YIG superfamily endonuclease
MVYLLHFDRPISERHTTQHYLGFTEDIEERLREHRAGHGARLTQVANERGIGYIVVRVWEDGDRTFERKLKNRKNAPCLCPKCREAAQERKKAALTAKTTA